jgi:pyridoxal phosphate enzyme (YggS family)
MKDSVSRNIERVWETIAAACEKAGRNPQEVTIVAVTKGVDTERMAEALACGIRVFGENRVQEAMKKMPAFAGMDVEWHFIGRIQRNKMKKILEHFHCVHSLDREDFGREMSHRLRSAGRGGYPVLLEVNLTGKETQGGVREEELPELVRRVAALPGLRIVGLMTIGPLGESEEGIRRVFRRLRELKDMVNALNIPGVFLTELSMGMSDDYHLAILEGATMVRLGRAIFGERRT